MKPQSLRFLVVSLACTLLSVSGSAYADGKTEGRKGHWDVSAFVGGASSNTMDRTEKILGTTVRSELDIDDLVLGGLRGEMHASRRWGFGLAFAFARPNFHVTAKGSGISASSGVGDLSLNWIDAAASFRFAKKDATPFVRFGVGRFNIAEKRIDEVTFATEGHFQYHVGIGYEWIIGKRLVMALEARGTASELDLWEDDLIFTQATVSVGYRGGKKDRADNRRMSY